MVNNGDIMVDNCVYTYIICINIYIYTYAYTHIYIYIGLSKNGCFMMENPIKMVDVMMKNMGVSQNEWGK